MVINGIEFDIDFTDAETIEKIETKSKEVLEVSEKLEKNAENMTQAQMIVEACTIMKEFLDYVIGKGTSDKLFGKKNSLMDCVRVYSEVINEKNRQFDNFNKIVNEYSPDRLER